MVPLQLTALLSALFLSLPAHATRTPSILGDWVVAETYCDCEGIPEERHDSALGTKFHLGTTQVDIPLAGGGCAKGTTLDYDAANNRSISNATIKKFDPQWPQITAWVDVTCDQLIFSHFALFRDGSLGYLNEGSRSYRLTRNP